MNKKVFVSVTAKFYADGTVAPLSLVWEDGTVYAVERVLDVRRAASLRAGGTGVRYTVQICGRPCRLFYEEPRWFVERKAD